MSQSPQDDESSIVEKVTYKRSSYWMRFLWWLKSLVYLWVRSKSLPRNAADLTWDPLKPVCYVLNSRSITDLFVLDHHCEKLKLPRPRLDMDELYQPGDGSFVYLSKSGFFSRKRSRAIPTGLCHLLEKVKGEQKDIQLIPVSVFWGRDAGKEEKSMLKLLFLDDQQGGWFQRFILFFVQGRNVFCNFGKPISLLEFINQEKELVSGAKKLRRVLRVHFHRKRDAMMGPNLYDRGHMIASILNSKSMRSFFDQEVEKKGKSREKLEDQARRYIDEIAANVSPPAIRFADIFLNWVFHRLYKGIDVQNGEVLRSLAETHELVYVPCHRSHMDYLLLSFSLYRLGVTPPHTAAGVNLNFWPIGGFFRKGGAFFIRRSFGGNKLYSAVFTEYVHFLLRGGYSMCFYMEGGRSRTGRLLQPKLGMISMVIKSFQESSEKPIMLIPTYIAYDKLMEARSYLHELRGKSKKAESLWQLLRMPKLLAYEFGKAYINFGEPIDLGNYLQKTPDSPQLIPGISKELMRRINRSIHLNPVSLFSVAFLALPKRAIAENRLVELVQRWLHLLRSIPYSDRVVIPKMDVREMLKNAESLAQLNRFEHTTGDVIFVNDRDCVFLNYYRNNVLPIFVLPSLVAHVASLCKVVKTDDLLRSVREAYGLLKQDFFLKWDGDEIEGVVHKHIEVMLSMGLLKTQGDTILTSQGESEEFFCLSSLGSVLGQILERYSLYISLLSRYKVGAAVDIEGLGRECEKLAKKSSILSGFHEFDLYDKSEYKQLIETMMDLGYLKRMGDEVQLQESANQCFERFRPLIDATLTKTSKEHLR